MSSAIIKELVGKVSCGLTQVETDDPKSLSALLPVLKNIHCECMKLSLPAQAGKIRDARNIINSSIKKNSHDIVEQVNVLESLMSDISKSFQTSNQVGEVPKTDTNSANGKEMGLVWDCFEQLEKKLNEFGSLIAGCCPGETRAQGAMHNIINDIVKISQEMEAPEFHQIAVSCKKYIKSITLVDTCNTGPFEEGLILLRSLLRHLKRGEPFAFDRSDVLELLEFDLKAGQVPKEIETNEEETVDTPLKEAVSISDDELEILTDFVSEALENLDTIEVNLMNLEQDPSSQECINDIFRLFHTIKGISGFLSLTKINMLAHTTENILDGARNGDFFINNTATDILLESVDTLKQLVAKVKRSVETRVRQPDDDIHIDGLQNRLQQLRTALAGKRKQPLGEILVKKGVVDRQSVEDSLKIQQYEPDKKLGEILVREKKVQPGRIASALMEQNVISKKINSQIKVSTQKLDDLVDYTGELVIAQSIFKQKTATDPILSNDVVHLGQIVTNLQNIAMSMRMIPIKATFMKMIRLVRDLSLKSGKKIDLRMTGEDTEIDRNVVDALYEPMVHMIRNSVDHGIEPAPDRIEKGKSQKGYIILRAYHKGGHIIIEIEDDGKGLDKDQIQDKALDTGIIQEDAKLNEAQVFDLIMQPGFSTARSITDVSGRGVGMDVVKQGIEKLNGQLNIESAKNKGTKFTISLPLTLAIIDGMLVRVDEERYVIPTISVQKVFKPGRKDCFTIEGKGELVKDRGRLIPLIRLKEIYDTGNLDKPIWEGLVVVVESKDEKRALLIDELLGKGEYVIKSLGKTFEAIKGFSGGAILADGRVGLILDIHGIFSLASKG